MKYLIIITVIFFNTSCSSVRHVTGEYVGDNPIEYVFDVPESEMREIIEVAFDFYRRKIRTDFKFYDLYREHHKEHDYILWNRFNYYRYVYEGYHYVSKVYFDRKGKGYNYCPFYIIFVNSVDISKTKVRIEAIEPKIRKSNKRLRYKPVNPTSVEEYELLLILGKEIGIEKEMPELKIPPKIIIRSFKIKK